MTEVHDKSQNADERHQKHGKQRREHGEDKLRLDGQEQRRNAQQHGRHIQPQADAELCPQNALRSNGDGLEKPQTAPLHGHGGDARHGNGAKQSDDEHTQRQKIVAYLRRHDAKRLDEIRHVLPVYQQGDARRKDEYCAQAAVNYISRV